MQNEDIPIPPSLPNLDHPEWSILIEILKQTLHTEKTRALTTDEIKQVTGNIVCKCPSLRLLTSILKHRHFQWQRDTILISFARKDSVQHIQYSIQTENEDVCVLCGDNDHYSELCTINKEIFKQNRFKAAINIRKSRMCGFCANSSPFRLLTSTLIPQTVFQEYSERFTPFLPGNHKSRDMKQTMYELALMFFNNKRWNRSPDNIVPYVKRLPPNFLSCHHKL